MTRAALSLLVLLGLVGCAAAPGRVAYETDLAKVAAIERAAQATGVKIYWVNQPQKIAVAGS